MEFSQQQEQEAVAVLEVVDQVVSAGLEAATGVRIDPGDLADLRQEAAQKAEQREQEREQLESMQEEVQALTESTSEALTLAKEQAQFIEEMIEQALEDPKTKGYAYVLREKHEEALERVSQLEQEHSELLESISPKFRSDGLLVESVAVLATRVEEGLAHTGEQIEQFKKDFALQREGLQELAMGGTDPELGALIDQLVEQDMARGALHGEQVGKLEALAEKLTKEQLGHLIPEELTAQLEAASSAAEAFEQQKEWIERSWEVTLERKMAGVDTGEPIAKAEFIESVRDNDISYGQEYKAWQAAQYEEGLQEVTQLVQELIADRDARDALAAKEMPREIDALMEAFADRREAEVNHIDRLESMARQLEDAGRFEAAERVLDVFDERMDSLVFRSTLEGGQREFYETLYKDQLHGRESGQPSTVEDVIDEIQESIKAADKQTAKLHRELTKEELKLERMTVRELEQAGKRYKENKGSGYAEAEIAKSAQEMVGDFESELKQLAKLKQTEFDAYSKAEDMMRKEYRHQMRKAKTDEERKQVETEFNGKDGNLLFARSKGRIEIIIEKKHEAKQDLEQEQRKLDAYREEVLASLEGLSEVEKKLRIQEARQQVREAMNETQGELQGAIVDRKGRIDLDAAAQYEERKNRLNPVNWF